MKQTLLFLISFSISINCSAQRPIFAAGEITYEHSSDSTYTFYANLYQDCAGGKEPDTVIACFNNPCDNSFSFTAKLAKSNNRGNVAQMGCSQYPTNCSEPGAIRGYRIWHYAATITLPAQCNSWHIAVIADTMTNSLALTPAKFYVETTFNNKGANKNNSSPFFIDDAIAYCGEGQPFSFRTQPIDPDGDSLVTEIVAPRTTDNQCGASRSIPYTRATPPYSIVHNPFQTNNTFQFDKNTDSMSFTPSTAGTAIMALKVYEYRNGHLLGTTLRTQVIHIMPAPLRGWFENITDIGNFYNCTYPYNRINAFVNDSFSFQIFEGSTANNAKLMLYDNCDSILPSAKIVYEGQYSKSVSGTFTCKPTIFDTGLHYIFIKAVDTTCDPPGFTYNSWNAIPIFIDPTPSNISSISKQKNIQLYPNPNSGHFKLNGYEPGLEKITLVNTMGQIIDADVKITNSEMNLSDNLPAGIYALKIYKYGSMQTLPFVINR